MEEERNGQDRGPGAWQARRLPFLCIALAAIGCGAQTQLDEPPQEMPPAATVVCPTASLKDDGGRASFGFRGDHLELNGRISETTPGILEGLMWIHPEVKYVVFGLVHGARGQAAAQDLARLVREHKLATCIAPGGHVQGAGLDVFVAGEGRSMSRGGQLWADPVLSGASNGKLSLLHSELGLSQTQSDYLFSPSSSQLDAERLQQLGVVQKLFLSLAKMSPGARDGFRSLPAGPSPADGG